MENKVKGLRQLRVSCSISLWRFIELQGKQLVELHHTAKAMWLMFASACLNHHLHQSVQNQVSVSNVTVFGGERKSSHEIIKINTQIRES